MKLIMNSFLLSEKPTKNNTLAGFISNEEVLSCAATSATNRIFVQQTNRLCNVTADCVMLLWLTTACTT